MFNGQGLHGCILLVPFLNVPFLMTLSFLVSGGSVSKLDNGYQKVMFYDILCQSFFWSMKQISVIKRKIRLVCSQSPCFQA